ncbi:VOC family protein [Paenibacillus tengchongensis]|uniref:VOC family protein n=1 Tax=Paenibacillus tengchongensis TaxID=2608684 RepID=UPI00124C6845|nr:VOC family protein [Paenibacillus tengchongensis]
MISASPYVIIEQVQESVEYYQSVLGGDIKVLNEHQGKWLHAELHLGQTLIHFSDDYGRGAKTENVSIILHLDTEEQLQGIYDKLKADGGKVSVELQKTFFGALHGQVSDVRNGITWVMNCFIGH